MPDTHDVIVGAGKSVFSPQYIFITGRWMGTVQCAAQAHAIYSKFKVYLPF